MKSRIAYHGTALSLAKKIVADGYIRPRKDGGNWSGGLSGGNPSCLDLVYVANFEEVAHRYAHTIATSKKEKYGAIIRVSIPSKLKLIPDEDLIFELLNQDSRVGYKIKQAYADMTGFDDIESALYAFREGEVSDSEMALQMCELAGYISKKWNGKSLEMLTTGADTMAVRGPVKVIDAVEIKL